MKTKRLLILLLFPILLIFAHSGKTDKYGGHNNRKTGGYHFHNAGYVHHPDNPFQNHSTCGVCTTKKKSVSSNDSDQSDTISADEAINYVGEVKTVCGKVESAFYSFNSNGKPTFLNIDKAYPNNKFVVVIWEDDRYKFSPVPEKKYQNQKICVTGKIIIYNSTAEIIVTNSNQIIIQK